MTYDLISLVSACIFGEVLWGLGLKFVFKRLRLKVHPSTRRLLPHAEPFNNLLYEILVGMRNKLRWLIYPFAYLVGGEALDEWQAILSGVGVVVLISTVCLLMLVRAGQEGQRELFGYFVSLFAKYPK